jgi:Entner-Doudoroff aldolase
VLMKLFPAQQAGGIGMLKAMAGPFPDVTFCPTGGVTVASAPDFLALSNVGCVGGSWLTPRDAVAAGDWSRITAPAREATGLRSHVRLPRGANFDPTVHGHWSAQRGPNELVTLFVQG